MKLHEIWRLIVQVFTAWSEDKAPRMGAALAYYSAFSMAPLVVLAIGVAGLAFDHQTARTAVLREIEKTVGEPAATAVDAMIQNVQTNGHSRWAAVIGLVTLLIGASGVFAELQDSLNTVWKVKPRPDRSYWDIIRQRIFSFAVVLGTGFLLLVSLIVTTVLAALGTWLSSQMPGGAAVWQFVNALVSFATVTLLFALIFKLLPDVQLQWRHVWIGAGVTAVLFTLGKYAIGLYLGQSGTTTAFGAAASLVIILIWVYYSAQIMLFGAECTRVLALRAGERVPASADAQPVTEAERAGQGLTPHPAQPARSDMAAAAHR
jgi:membrane protein